VHLVGFIIEIYYDARPYERQICFWPLCVVFIVYLLTGGDKLMTDDRQMMVVVIIWICNKKSFNIFKILYCGLP